MDSLLALVAVLLCLATLPGTLELALVTAGALLPRRRLHGPLGRAPRMAVVVPAHDDAGTIGRCLGSLLADDPGLEVFVVAENCTDDTGAVAAVLGARVIVHRDPRRRGRGFALDVAFRRLSAEGFEALAVVDARSVADERFASECRRLLAGGAHAVQARLGALDTDGPLRARLARVAPLGHHVLRPRGRDRLGLSAGFFGEGFALSSATLRAVPPDPADLAGGGDYHLKLLRAGRRVRFADQAWVRTDLPAVSARSRGGRARRAAARLRAFRAEITALLREVGRGRLRLAEPALEHLAAPLALHVPLLVLAWIALAGEPLAWLPEACLAVALVHVVSALVIGEASAADLAALLAMPLYLVWELASPILGAPRAGPRASGAEDPARDRA